MARFALVGMLATGVHFAVALATLKLLVGSPPLANAAGFTFAVILSYLGHSVFTFRATVTTSSAARFVIVSLATVMLGTACVAWLSHHTPWPGSWVLAIGALFSAGINFIGHSSWSFGTAS